MSHSTFKWNKLSVYSNFGALRIEEYSVPEHNQNSQLTLGQVKKDLSNYHANNYTILPYELVQGCTYKDKPIVFMLAYVGHKEHTFIIYTRNE